MWDALLEAGKDEGLIPCGLGARDTLRMEAAMPLYGHEMDDEIDRPEICSQDGKRGRLHRKESHGRAW